MCNYTCGGYAQQPVWNAVPCNATVVCNTQAAEGEKERPGLCFILVLFILLALICNVVGGSDDSDDDDCCDCCDCY